MISHPSSRNLAGDSFAAKEKAVIALGALGDPRAVPILQALTDGRLLKSADGRVVISLTDGGTTRVRDAVTGDDIAGADADSLDRIIVNNRLRGAIEGALGALTLFSTDPAARLTAAQDALRHPSAAEAALLEKAIAAEKDPEIRAAMQQSLAAARLVSGSKEERLAAIRALGTTTDPQIRNLLDEFRAAPDTDPELQKAADAALASIGDRLRLVGIAANLFQGVSLGSVLLLAAIGLAITFGVMGVINMAHGEMIMLGAYTAYVCQQLFRAFLPADWIDAYLSVAVPVAFLFAGAVGVVLERSVIRFLYGRPLETLLATWGVSLILQQAVRSIFGSPNKEVSNPSWMTGGFDPIGGFTITWNRLYIIVFCFIVFGALALILYRTSFGLHMRAVTQNRADGLGDGYSDRAGRCADLRPRLGNRRHGRGGAEPGRQCQSQSRHDLHRRQLSRRRVRRGREFDGDPGRRPCPSASSTNSSSRSPGRSSERSSCWWRSYYSSSAVRAVSSRSRAAQRRRRGKTVPVLPGGQHKNAWSPGFWAGFARLRDGTGSGRAAPQLCGCRRTLRSRCPITSFRCWASTCATRCWR